MKKLKDLAVALKKLRKETRGIDQQGLVAESLGVTQQRYSKIESTGKMTTEMLFDVLDVLGAELQIVPKDKQGSANDDPTINQFLQKTGNSSSVSSADISFLLEKLGLVQSDVSGRDRVTERVFFEKRLAKMINDYSSGKFTDDSNPTSVFWLNKFSSSSKDED